MLPLALLALAVAQADAVGPGDHTRSLTVGDLKRTYMDFLRPHSRSPQTRGAW
jgi:hypothetical protein